MSRQCSALLLALLLLGAACNGSRSERVAASYSTVTKPTERSLPGDEPRRATSAIEAIPVEEDYEVRAAASITEANLAAKLLELERELRL